MKYVVTHLTSRGQKYILPQSFDTLEDAMADARTRWEHAIDYNTYVTVRIAKQEK